MINLTKRGIVFFGIIIFSCINPKNARAFAQAFFARIPLRGGFARAAAKISNGNFGYRRGIPKKCYVLNSTPRRAPNKMYLRWLGSFLAVNCIFSVNAFTQQIDLREIGPEFQKMDANKDGFVTSKEMQAYQEKRFTELDKDKSGTIDLTELEVDKTKMLEKADKDKDEKVSPKEATAQFNEHFNAMDSNKDGTVSEKEYKEYWPVTVKF